MSPHNITKQFEKAVGEYTGAPYVVAVNSCTMALLLACAYRLRPDAPMTASEVIFRKGDGVHFEIPKRTYVSVPQSVKHAGGKPIFRDEDWSGEYQLKPWNIWDSARRFTSGMYRAGQMQCVSFHASKTLGDTQGGAILLDDPKADIWLRKARFDGRTEGIPPHLDTFDMLGWHCYMSVDVAARLLFKLSVLPLHNADLPNSDYPDLSLIEAFQ